MYLKASIKPKPIALAEYQRCASRTSCWPARFARAYSQAAASRKKRKKVSSFAVRLMPVALTSRAQSRLAHAAIRISGKSSRHSRKMTSVVRTPPTTALGNRTAVSGEMRKEGRWRSFGGRFGGRGALARSASSDVISRVVSRRMDIYYREAYHG